MTDFADIFAGLDHMERTIEQGATKGLQTGAGLLQGIAQASTAYDDQTGATRAGTVAYAATPKDDGSGAFAAALAAVQEHNAEHAFSGTTDEGVDDDTYAVVLTVPTDYIGHLVVEHAGAHDPIGGVMQQH